MRDTRLAETAAALERVLEEAARKARSVYAGGVAARVKVDGTPVTEADLQIHAFLRGALAQLRPGADWISEEDTSREAAPSEWCWIVDPLDGTKEFAMGIPECAISIGLVHRGRAVLGGVMNPFTEEWGIGGIGSEIRYGGLRPQPAVATRLASATASVSRTEWQQGLMAPYLHLFGSVRPVGSVAYKLLRVASGLEDLTFSLEPKSLWDICGGVALVQAAGGCYRRLDGQPCHLTPDALRIRCGAAAGPARLVNALFRTSIAREEPWRCRA